MNEHETGTSEVWIASGDVLLERGDGRGATQGQRGVAAVLVVMLGLAAASWALSVRLMNGMDMGAATELGPFGFFIASWATMMAGMMLPGAVPAVQRRVRASGRASAIPAFVGSYLAVWAVVGVVVYAVYRPHGTLAAGVVAIAAGIYELTPLKRYFRQHCREGTHSGLGFGLYCVGSSVGLMSLFVAVGVMSVAWMSVIALLALAQKLLPPTAVIDVPIGLAIFGLGLLILITPSAVPGLALAM